MRHVALTVNGMRHELEVEPRELLVFVLRERLGLTGTNVGCDTSSCGSCTVLVGRPAEGRIAYRPVTSCIQYVAQLDASHVVTVEGLAYDGELNPVQRAMVEHHGAQCGFCTPGMVMAAEALLRKVKNPTEAQVRQALGGNLCRCTGYVKILEAVQAAAQ